MSKLSPIIKWKVKKFILATLTSYCFSIFVLTQIISHEYNNGQYKRYCPNKTNSN